MGKELSMSDPEKTLTVRSGDHGQPGLYVTLKDNTRIELTRENIEKTTSAYWADPTKIPPGVKKAVEFQRCEFCPMKEKADFCDALRPVLPLLDALDSYNSFDDATAVYKGDNKELHHLSFTSMQRVLRYISTLSLMGYCRVGRKYWKYFTGIIPVLGIEAIVNRMYLNMYWLHNGNTDAVDRVISELNSVILVTAKNQMARLRLICKNDAFLNAFALTHMITTLLYDVKDSNLLEQMERFEDGKSYG